MSDQPIVDRIRRRLSADSSDPTPSSVAEALRAEHQVAGSSTVLRLVDQLRSETRGAGLLDPLLAMPDVTDVLVNGPDDVYVDRGLGLEAMAVRFEDDDAVRRLAQRLAAQAGRRLDDASPWVDARLHDGTRLHAVLAPLARPGTVISLRIPARRSYSLAALREAGSLTGDGLHLLQRLVSSRAAFLVTGGTGTGKTTLLSALLSEVAPAERIVVVEDATELRPDHPHVVGLEARPANAEGAGRVTVRDLVRQALRMRPDRLVVGEVRGAEVVDLLAALNTGHEGGCGTVHANSTADVPARFEALGVAAGLPREAVHSQLAAGIDVVVHVARSRGGLRTVDQVAVIERTAGGVVSCAPAVTFRDGRTVEGRGSERLLEVLG
ncbi:TadA family conjugal transfer-associated ATPase [Aeromicrobium wangtongii]|uniref:TadA family conjugal transfer-associated ATPase n=1 Tax=Aeromicrobium wangtongii TaxID=2969247 RepID=A0ABY5MDU2_9ACTN|nr:TadA family conjugal transfer-associated ATPase [Aeromicrobium wangtongii]MCD9199640.1 TadA family conjugal transfer-associated ATPase [Aeromicrobium wangtongii]UUP13991.1 TadA family conjugal transfer-associated ATPase [Aeromicrobium wangtongii]